MQIFPIATTLTAASTYFNRHALLLLLSSVDAIRVLRDSSLQAQRAMSQHAIPQRANVQLVKTGWLR